MELGQTYKEYLPRSHRKALGEAAVHLIDDSLQELLFSFEPEWSPEEWTLGELLPERFFSKYTGDFARRFFFCLSTVIWKLGQPEVIQPACTAEELATHALLWTAENILEDEGVEADFSDLIDEFLGDTDALFLYNTDIEIENSPAATELHMANLRFEDWFKPFRSDRHVHPYSQHKHPSHGNTSDIPDYSHVTDTPGEPQKLDQYTPQLGTPQEFCTVQNWVTLACRTLSDGQIISWAIADSFGTLLGDGLIRPTGVYSSDYLEYLGISESDLQSAPTFIEAWPKLAAIFEGKESVAIFGLISTVASLHISAPYSFEMANLEHLPLACTLSYFTDAFTDWTSHFGEEGWQNLRTACLLLDIDQPGIHNTAQQAQAAAHVMRKLAVLSAGELSPLPGTHDLEEVTNGRRTWRCKKCQQVWNSPTSSRCPGVPTYKDSSQVTSERMYLSWTQLHGMGIQPRLPIPHAAMRVKGKLGFVYLYDSESIMDEHDLEVTDEESDQAVTDLAEVLEAAALRHAHDASLFPDSLN